MRFTYQTACECGGEMVFLAIGEESFRPGECSSCGKTDHLFDPLSVSVTAERLLNRSKTELENGDFSLSMAWRKKQFPMKSTMSRALTTV